MRNHDRHRASTVESLRLAIDCMPVATREAMLRGVSENERIIVGAYVDELGGVCPMLAAHRCGGRTDFLSFAKSWDRFTRARGVGRPATERELSILLAQLQDSLMSASGVEFDEAIAEHRHLIASGIRRRRASREQADPTGEIIARRLLRKTRRARFDGTVAASSTRSLATPAPVRG
jgi:hypothetical protein